MNAPNPYVNVLPLVEIGERPEDALLIPVRDEETADDGNVKVGGQRVLRLAGRARHDARRVQLVAHLGAGRAPGLGGRDDRGRRGWRWVRRGSRGGLCGRRGDVPEAGRLRGWERG